MKGKFLIKGGKGKVGVGEQKIKEEDIVIIYKDILPEINKMEFFLNDQITFLDTDIISNKSVLEYNRVTFTQMVNDDLSGVSIYNTGYLLVKNTKGKFFLRIKKREDIRFDPRGTLIKLFRPQGGNLDFFTSIAFYCLVNEAPTYVDGDNVFYKVYPENTETLSYDFGATTYDFSIIRESMPSSSDVKLIDVAPSLEVTANEIKAEVKSGILYLTIKNAKASTKLTSFLICELPTNYIPSRSFNLNFINASGDSFLGEIDVNGKITVTVNNETEEGVYLQASIPI